MATPVTVTVGPLATADADGVTLSQKAAGAEYLAINGALTDGGTANNVCQSQTPAGAGALTLNGTLVSGGVVHLGSMQRIYFTHAGNDSARTLTIVGQGISPAGYYAVTETLTASNASIVASQQRYYTISSITISGAAAGAITVGRAGTGTLDLARRVIITSGGNDTGITFTIYGTDTSGNAQSEAVTGASGGAAASALCYKTVTDVKTSGAAATTVTVGTNGVADAWVCFDGLAANAQTAIAAAVTGTVNYDIELSQDRPNTPGTYAYGNPALMTWIDSLDTAVVGATASKNSYFAYTPVWARVILNSGTGSVRATFLQAYYGD